MIYKYYRDDSKCAIENFKSGQICFSHVDLFNDYLEFNAQFSNDVSLNGTLGDLTNYEIEMQKFGIRIACFSKKPNLDNMWGYYANNGKGFCLGYDEHDIEKISQSIQLKEVYYSDDPPTLGEGMSKSEILIKQVTHKKACWREEQEVRAIYSLNESDYYKFDLRLGCSDYGDMAKPIFNDLIKISCPPIPLDKPSEQRIPFDWYAPRNFLIMLEPKVLIIGKNSPEDTIMILESIARLKNIMIKNVGGKIE